MVWRLPRGTGVISWRLTASAILGRDLDSLGGERLGRIERVISDADGEVTVLVVRIGNRRHVVPAAAVELAPWGETSAAGRRRPPDAAYVPRDHHARSQVTVHFSEEQARQLGVDLAASYGLAQTFSIEDAIATAARHAEPAQEGAWSSTSEGECPAPGAEVRELLRRLESARLLVVEASGRYRFLAPGE